MIIKKWDFTIRLKSKNSQVYIRNYSRGLDSFIIINWNQKWVNNWIASRTCEWNLRKRFY
jgi:hypothetical protein